MAGAEQCGFKGQSRSQEGEQVSVKSEGGLGASPGVLDHPAKGLCVGDMILGGSLPCCLWVKGH